ncbi:MAG: hypothetical protein WCD18_22355 [Thermosynechococcaceae cyanobacterium]
MNRYIILNLKQYHQSNNGFALPLSMMLGLVMITMGFASMLVGQNNRDFAKSRSDSNLNTIATEGGVARILVELSSANNSQLLTQNYDPINPDTGKTFLGPDGIINSGDEESVAVDQWADNTSSNCLGGGSVTLPSINYSGTIGVNSNYTLQAYRYDSDKQQGHLLVTGEQGNQKSSVKITLSLAVSSYAKIPGLWLKDNSKSKTSGGELQTNILDSTCPNDSNSSNIASLKGAQAPIPPSNTPVTYNEQPGLSFPTLPTEGLAPPITGSPGAYSLAQITNSTVSLPRSGDVPQGGILTYHVGSQKSIQLSGGNTLSLGTGNETIILYLDGGIDLSGGSSIKLISGTKLIIYARGDLTLSGGSTTAAIENSNLSTDVQIYNYSQGKVTLSGGSAMKMFMFAPQSVVTFSSSSKVEGTIWAQSWVGSGSATLTENSLNLSQAKVRGFPGKIQITGIANWQSK